MIMKRTTLLLIIMCLASTTLWARLGGAGLNFLIVNAGSRPSALGGAYAALANDLDAIYFNPAGISALNRFSLNFSYTPYFADMSYQSMAMAIPSGMFGTIGLSLLSLQSGDIEKTTLDEPNGTNSSYSASDYAFGVTLARPLTDKFSVGGTMKFITEGIDEVSCFGWAIDLGATYNTGFKNFRLGFSILNFGPDMQFKGDVLKFHYKPVDPNDPEENDLMEEDAQAQWESEKIPLPLMFQFGLAVDLIQTSAYRVTFTADKVNPTDQVETFAVGMEVGYLEFLNLRVGYSDKNDGNFAAGAGIILPMGNSKAIFDYAFRNHQYLDALHTFALTLVF